MSALAPGIICDAILQGLYESGAQARLISPTRAHPRKFQVVYEGATFSLWVYIWTVTHGGASRSLEEYRIQMTTVKPPLAMNPAGPTLLLGWNPEHGVFAGFDIIKHRAGFRVGSNSVQISLSALLAAENFSWGFYTNQFREVAVAFRPQELLHYVQNARALHEFGAPSADLLNKVAKMEKVDAKSVVRMSAPRRKVVQTMTKIVRDSAFRNVVTSAYEHRCAVTRIQLNLIDAAHVYPVEGEGSTDEVTNGICLSPTYHRAFDRGLIYLSEDYKMRINPKTLDELQAMDLAGGLDHFGQYLDQDIFLPVNPAQRPNVECIRRGNQFRSIPA